MSFMAVPYLHPNSKPEFVHVKRIPLRVNLRFRTLLRADSSWGIAAILWSVNQIIDVMRHEAVTKADIERDIASMNLKDEHRPVMIALAEFQNGLPVDQNCTFCQSPIVVEGHNAGRPTPSVWITSCACGKCNSTFRGL